MVFIASGGGFNHGNDSHWLDQKLPSFPRSTYSDNTNWGAVDVCMSVSEEAIRKAAVRVNTPLECWRWTNSSRYHEYRFHAYINCPNKIYPDVVERVKHSIQEYARRNSGLGENRASWTNQVRWGKTSPTTTRSIFTDRRVQLTHSWKDEGFSSLYQAFLMCEMVYPYTSRATRVSCTIAINEKLRRS